MFGLTAHGPSRLERAIMDEVVLAYVEWREECSAVRQVYARWPEASSGEAGLAQAAYSAALDREEAAARTYAQLIELSARC